jgi:hypothetical protein
MGFFYPDAAFFSQIVDNLKTNIVPVRAILFTWIPKADDDERQ